MAHRILVIFEKPIMLSFEPADPHLFATALGVADTPLEISVLLRDSAVTYAVSAQAVSARILGQEIAPSGTTPARLVTFMLEHGAVVRVVREDLDERGIPPSDLVTGVRVVGRSDTAEIFAENDGVILW
ncbi:MAG: DsrE family protein [Nitrospiraceae bacterium]|nr:DsrE family protein [Nitrospiraceae bacterium]